jgi:mono/diheme cytochrome c family protein
MVDGAYVADFPLEIDVADVRWGRTRFEIFCATCHGTLGTGQTQVAENMRLRKPPSLHSAAIRAYPPGRIFAVISRGYGLMPSYAGQLSVADRWAVVAYVQALQLSQDFSLTGEDAQGIREKLK